MDRKRKLDSTAEEAEEKGSLPQNDAISSQEILAIILADDYERLQENIENGKIEDVNLVINIFTRSSLLMTACKAGSVDCAKVLLSNNADVNYRGLVGSSAVSSAAEGGNIDIVNLIISREDLNINLLYQPLHEHICDPSDFPLSTELVKLFISRLPDINYRLYGDSVLLNLASFFGRVDLARLLLESGADPNVTDQAQYDALYIATMEGHIDIVKLLFEYDSPHKITTKSTNTAYLCACYYGRVDMVRYMLEHGADIYATEENGCFAIDHALLKNNIPLAKLLIEKGFDVNSIYLERSALYFACAQRYEEMVQLLLDHGADPDLRYPDGSSLLLRLVEGTCDKDGDYTPYTTLLLNRGANVNIAHSISSQTALMIAGAAANADLLKLLLEHGADVTKVNSEGRSVLDMVGRTRSHAKVAELCQAYIDSNRVDAKAILK